MVLDFVRRASEAQELLRRPNGRMYEVELGVQPADLLDWDAPVFGQDISDLLPGMRQYGRIESAVPASATGEEFYEAAEGILGSRESAARALREAGIPGIRYLDQASRAPAAMAPSQARQLRAGIADVDRQVTELREEIAANRSTPGLTGQFFARREADLRALDERRANLQRQLDDVEAGNNLSRNYVIFDERLIRIVRKYGIAGLAAALGVSYPEAAALAAEQGIEDDMPRFGMGGQVDANEVNPNYAGEDGITATDRALEGIAQPQRLASGGQARGGPRRPPPTAEERAALYTRLEQQYDLPEGYLARVRAIESSDGTRLFNRNSRAAGPFQFIPRTATAMGLRDPYDEIASAEAAARLAAENAQALRRRGFEIDAPTLYLAHQQGATGAVRLLQGNRPAVDIVGRNAVVWNAGNENMTGPQFAGRILDSFRGVPAQPPQAAPAQAAAPAEPPAIPRIGALPPVQASAQPAAQAPAQQPTAPAAQAPMPIPFPPPPAPPVPAARQRRADDPSVMRDVIAGLEMQGSGAGQPSPIERHLQMVQQGQRRYATAMPEQEPTMMAQGGLARTLGAMGRGNDSLVAHITPREALALKAMGGSGTTNPYTGMLEFDDGGGDGGGGDGGGGDGGGGDGADGGGSDSGGGDADGAGAGVGDAGFGGMGDDGFGGGPDGSFGGMADAGFGGMADDGFGGGPEGSFGGMANAGFASMADDGFGGGPEGSFGAGFGDAFGDAFGGGYNDGTGGDGGSSPASSVPFMAPAPVAAPTEAATAAAPSAVNFGRTFSPLSGDPTRYGFGGERAFYTPGFAEGGRVSPELSYEAQRFLDVLRQADLEASGGGIFTPIPGGRVAGGGVNARAAVPVGRDSAALDFSAGQQGVSASGRGFRSNQSRMTGAGVGYTTPSGGRLSLDYHDRMMGDPDTLPGADPIELINRPAPSRGLRLGYRREF